MLDISRIESGRVHLKVEPLNLAESIDGAVDTFRAVLSQTDRTIDVQGARAPAARGRRPRPRRPGAHQPHQQRDQVLAGRRPGHHHRHARRRLRDRLGHRPGPRHQPRRPEAAVHQVLPGRHGDDARDRRHRPGAVDLQDDHRAARRRDRLHEQARQGLDVLVQRCRSRPRRWCARRRSRGRTRSGGTVLVIDRDPEVADLIETYLRRRGYDVVKAHTADEALAVALKVQAARDHARRDPRRGRRVRPAAPPQGAPRDARHPRRRALDRVRRGQELPHGRGELPREADRPGPAAQDDRRDRRVDLLAGRARGRRRPRRGQGALGDAAQEGVRGRRRLRRHRGGRGARAADPRHHRDRPQDAQDGRLRAHPARQDDARVGRDPDRRHDRAPHRPQPHRRARARRAPPPQAVLARADRRRGRGGPRRAWAEEVAT